MELERKSETRREMEKMDKEPEESVLLRASLAAMWQSVALVCGQEQTSDCWERGDGL